MCCRPAVARLVGIRHGKTAPDRGGRILVEALLGWTIHGPIAPSSEVSEPSKVLALRTAVEDNRGCIRRKLWELESIDIIDDSHKAGLEEAVKYFGETVVMKGQR